MPTTMRPCHKRSRGRGIDRIDAGGVEDHWERGECEGRGGREAMERSEMVKDVWG